MCKAYIHSIAKYPPSKIYFSEKYAIGNEEWERFTLLPGLVTLDTKTSIFQYKILNNILYLNTRPYKMQTVDLSAIVGLYLMIEIQIQF